MGWEVSWEDRFFPVAPSPFDETHTCAVCGAAYPAALAGCGCGRCLAERGAVVALDLDEDSGEGRP